MIGAIPLSAYQKELSRLNEKYDEQLSGDVAKEAYKQKRGYKIAWNWANEKEIFYPRYARRIERNRNQAIYRLTRRFDLSFLNDLLTGNTSDFSRAQTLLTGPYWMIGGGPIINWINAVEAQGITVVFGIWDDQSQTQRTYRDKLQREKAVRQMIRQCGKWQDIDNNSGEPFIQLKSGIVKNIANLTYFNLIVER